MGEARLIRVIPAQDPPSLRAQANRRFPPYMIKTASTMIRQDQQDLKDADRFAALPWMVDLGRSLC